MDTHAALDSFTLELGRNSELGLAIALATMMFSVALNLSAHNFRFLRNAPRPYLVGVFGQLLALPLMTLGLCSVLSPPPTVALGMILVACCPGGNVSNMLVLLARGNIALSVSLTATSSLIAAFLTPIAIIFWSGLYSPTAELLASIDFDTLKFLLQTAIVLALPLLLGMLCQRYAPTLSSNIKKPLVLLSSLSLLVIIVAGVSKYWQTFLVTGVTVLGVVLVHNACAFTLGNALARLNKLRVADRRALTYEVGIQNSGLGLVILLTQMQGLGGAVIVTAIWGTWHIIAGLALVALFRWSDRRN